MRPGMVSGKEVGLLEMVKRLGSSVKVDKLAGAMVRIALEGVGKQIIFMHEQRDLDSIHFREKFRYMD